MNLPRNSRPRLNKPGKEAVQASPNGSSRSSREDYLLDVLEMAINRDPDQDFELILVLEREKTNRESSDRSNRQKRQ